MNNYYRCLKPTCQFRFPAITTEAHNYCPKCGSPVQVIESKDLDIPSQPIHKSSIVIEVLLDNIRSAYNVGAIMRTADGAGVNRIHLLGITPTPDNPKVQKTALGAGTTIAWSQYWSYSEFLAQNQRYQYQVLGLEGGQQSSPLFDLPVNSDFHYLLVIGNEIQGINPEIISDANSIVYLPMLGAKRSLNVSVACSIALYWLRFISQGRDGR